MLAVSEERAEAQASMISDPSEKGAAPPSPLSPEMAVAQIARGWQLRLSERLAPLGLTAAQWRALRAVASRIHGMGQRELAAQIGVEEPGVVRLVDTLEAAGLVTRRVGATDRRSRIVQATSLAGPVIEEAMRINEELDRELFEGVPREDLDTCGWVLRRLLYKLQALRPLDNGRQQQG